MADNFSNKGYEDYFKALERQLNKSGAPEVKKVAEPEVKPEAARKHSKGVYKVIKLRKSVIAVVLVLCLVAVSSVIIAAVSKNKAETKPQISDAENKEPKIEHKPSISYTIPDDVTDVVLENDAKSIVIVDKEAKKVVAARNPHTREYPASTTKIMTLLVAVENITDWDAKFTMTLDITDPLFVAEASVAGFLNGEQVSMTDLLYGTILPSGADAAMGLAISVAGSEEEFVKLMNDKVKELGLRNTNFTNVTGLHNENNYSSAYDLAIILDAALQNETCKKVLSTYQYKTAVTPQHPEGIELSGTLFSYMYGTEPETATILGGKTGFVNESGYCIASYGKGNESSKEYIIVTMGNTGRWPAFYGQIDLYKHYAK